ncbi:hypothetical protein MIND_00664700 [Mycena indigotica]|uniref:Retrotransposon gag domain-containing protein n=1 Tax=Mycena indigotica TaxID=2126181 RepID=A0A8H6SKE0_9AGAR|nr:uncharacterized protein MIND_00664700 [Mycena indigotica]KAF7301011.1 hypothetical protein MIND_00664700 [Mycena indigotica]
MAPLVFLLSHHLAELAKVLAGSPSVPVRVPAHGPAGSHVPRAKKAGLVGLLAAPGPRPSSSPAREQPPHLQIASQPTEAFDVGTPLVTWRHSFSSSPTTSPSLPKSSLGAPASPFASPHTAPLAATSRERRKPVSSAASRPGPRPSSSPAREQPPHLQIASRTRLSPPALSSGSTEPASPLPTDDDASLAASLSPCGSTSPVSLHSLPTPPPPSLHFHLNPLPSPHAPLSAPRNPRAKMTKLISFPAFTDDPTPLSVRSWIGRCEDTIESFEAVNPTHGLATRNFITLAGLKLEQRAVSNWWEENRDELKKLSSFDDFAIKLRDKAHWTQSNGSNRLKEAVDS